MKTHISLFLITLQLTLFCGCNQDDGDVSPSYEDKNWYVIQDKPDSPLDHLIYTVYKDTGMPIFYNDTIGQENRRLDASGQPHVYHEVLDLSYSINQNVQQGFALSNNQEDIRNGVELLRDFVIPHLSEKMKPKCFLLVEELTDRQDRIPVYAFKKFLTTAVGWVSKLKNMSEAERLNVAATILGTEIAPYLRITYPGEIEDFYAVSTSFSISKTIYYVQIKEGMSATVPYEKWEFYGFLNPFPKGIVTTGVKSYRTPNENQDLVDFIGQVILTKEADFHQKYADYEAVLRKYSIIKELIDKNKK